MAISKSAKIQAEIEKVMAKINEQQARLKELEQKKLEAENRDRGDRARHERFAHRPARAASDHQERRHFGTDCPEVRFRG